MVRTGRVVDSPVLPSQKLRRRRLLNNGLQDRLEAGEGDEIERHRRTTEAKRLTLPGEMGERFKVMGLQRGVDATAQFEFGDQSHRL